MPEAHQQIRVASESIKRPMPRRLLFTEAKLAQLTCPPTKKTTSVYDTKVAGLCYVVTRNGSRSYYLYRKWRGRKINELLGKSAQINVATARELAAAMNARINAGADVQAERRQKRRAIDGALTLYELWKRYKSDYLDLQATARTVATDESRIKLLAPIHSRKVQTLTTEELQALHRQIGKDSGKQTADHALKLIRRMFNFGKIAPNPAGNKRISWFIGKRENERSRYITAEEMPRFLAALELEPNETLRDFIKASLVIGQRRANMQAMKWSELDLAAGIWTIPGASHKTRTDTRIPLTPVAVAMLNDRRQRLGEDVGEYVFPSLRKDAKVPHITEPRYVLDRICKAAKIDDLTLHDLRRSMGVWQALGGASELIIGASLGHRDRESTRRYSQIAQLDPVRSSMATAVNAMFGLPAPKVEPPKRKPAKRKKGGTAKKRKKN